MAIKYLCESCGATMTLAAKVSTVKCPVCRLAMAAVDEATEAAKPKAVKPAPPQPASTPVAPAPAEPSPESTASAMPAGIKIAQPVTERSSHIAAGTAQAVAATGLSQQGPPADAAAQRLMADARAEADRILAEAEAQREEILDHAEAHARQEVEEYFEKARAEAAQMKAESESAILKAADEARAKSEKEALAAVDTTNGKLAEVEKKLAEAERKAEEAEKKLIEAVPQGADPEIEKKLAEAERKAVEAETKLAALSAASASAPETPEAPAELHTEATTKAAVDKALSEERDRLAKQDLLIRKGDVNAYAKREARFLFAGSIFGVAVLFYAGFMIGSGHLTPLMQKFSFAMIALDALLFILLVGIVVHHYRQGRKVIDKQKLKKQGTSTGEDTKPGSSNAAASARGSDKAAKSKLSSSRQKTEGPNKAVVADQGSQGKTPKQAKIGKIKMSAKRSVAAGSAGKGGIKGAALREAAKRAAAKRAGTKTK